jgi:hypothetical protein
VNPQEMKIRAAEEVAHEFPSPKQARELIRKIDEFSIRLSVDIKSTTLEERLKYRAMYQRLSGFYYQIGDDCSGPNNWELASVVFIDIDEDSIRSGVWIWGA